MTYLLEREAKPFSLPTHGARFETQKRGLSPPSRFSDDGYQAERDRRRRPGSPSSLMPAFELNDGSRAVAPGTVRACSVLSFRGCPRSASDDRHQSEPIGWARQNGERRSAPASWPRQHRNLRPRIGTRFRRQPSCRESLAAHARHAAPSWAYPSSRSGHGSSVPTLRPASVAASTPNARRVAGSSSAAG